MKKISRVALRTRFKICRIYMVLFLIRTVAVFNRKLEIVFGSAGWVSCMPATYHYQC